MTSLLPIVVAGLALTAFAGVCVIAWAPSYWRRPLALAVPAVGAAALVVALHATALVVGVKVGLPVVLGVGGFLLVVRSLREPWWRDLGDRRWIAASLIAGAIPFAFVIGPARTYGATLVQPPYNNDAFVYVTVPAWLADHAATARPTAKDAPVWGYVRAHLETGVRIGESLDEAAIALASAQDPENSWYTATALWLALLPGAVMAALSILGLGPVPGLIAGLLAATSSLATFQVFNQNSAGILGMAFVPIAAALLARRLDADANGTRDGPPLWLTAGAVAALVGTYTEYLPVLALGVVGLVVLRRPKAIARASLSLARVAVLAAVMAPLVFYDAERSLRYTTGILDRSPRSPFLGQPLDTVIDRVVGAVAPTLGGSSRVMPLLAAAVVVGCAAAVALSPIRRLAVSMIVSATVVVVLLSTVHYFPYGQARAIEIFVPLLVMIVVAGWHALITRAATTRWRWLGGVAFAGALAAALVAGYVNHRSSGQTAAIEMGHFHVDSDFAAARTWLHSVARPDGSDAMVIVPDYFDQLWTLYGLRDMPRTTFLALYPDYSHAEPLQFDDGHARRFAVIGAGTFLDVDPNVVVGRTKRFLFLDLSHGSAVIGVGAVNFWQPETDPAGSHQWMRDDGTFLLAHTPDVHSVVVGLRAQSDLDPLPVTIAGPGASRQTVTLGSGLVDVRLGLPDDTLTTFQILNSDPARSPGPSDQRVLSVDVAAVRRD